MSFILNWNEYKYVCGVCVYLENENDFEGRKLHETKWNYFRHSKKKKKMLSNLSRKWLAENTESHHMHAAHVSYIEKQQKLLSKSQSRIEESTATEHQKKTKKKFSQRTK